MRIAHDTVKPTIATGGNRDFNDMQRMIETTDIGYVGLARPLLANPGLINGFYADYLEKNKR